MTKSRCLATLAMLALAASLASCGGGNSSGGESSQSGAGAPFSARALLTAGDVQQVISLAVTQAVHDGVNVVVAVSDTEGNILGVWEMKPGLGETPSVDGDGPPLSLVNTIAPFKNTKASIAIEKARTAAFLSSNQNAFSTTTGFEIVQDHFPPQVMDVPQGPLFMLTMSQLPCSDVRPANGVTGEPGGIPLYKNGAFAGGVGVDGAGSGPVGLSEEDEVIALAASANGYPPPPGITADNIFLGGITLQYANTAPPPALPAIAFGSLPGDIDSACFTGLMTNCPAAPTDAVAIPCEVSTAGCSTFGGVLGNLRKPIVDGAPVMAPDGSMVNLTAADVNLIFNQSIALAVRTRAAIREPVGVPARMHVGITDTTGAILGEFSMNDATGFSFEIVIQKGRTVTAFSDPTQPLGKQIRGVLGLPPEQPVAFTSRSIEFLAQPFYPPGIDANPPGPFNGIQLQLFQQGGAPSCAPYSPGDGICLFPGSVPLYKNGALVGGLGLSGDGVDQDDFITVGGAQGYLPPTNITADHLSFRGTPIPYVKFPRHPLL